ncbi:MAG: hypothetical protein ACXWT1_18930 [Methylobacter sp.]
MDNSERFGGITTESHLRLVLSARHFPATFSTFLTGLDAFIHTADILAAQRARLTDFGANLANTTMKSRIHELKIGRCLTYLSAADHKTEMFCLDVLAAGFEAVVHGGLKADLMAMTTRFYTGLHGVFSMCWLFHEILLKRIQRWAKVFSTKTKARQGAKSLETD